MTKAHLVWALLIALTIGAIVGVIYGVVSHTEAGFTDAGNAWGDTPITVTCRHYTGSSEGCDTASSVVSTINGRLGFPVYRYVSEDGADVQVTIGVPQLVGDTEHAHGRTELRGSNNVYQGCEVTTSNTGTLEMLHLVLYHELGCHCLGLAHDDYEQSICRPEQSSTPDGVFPPRISDFDREQLRGKYRAE